MRVDILIFSIFKFGKSKLIPTEIPVTETFDSWVIKYDKSYSTVQELDYRRDVWEKNEKIEKHNYEADRGNATYHMGINQLTDLTGAEFRNLYLAPRLTDKPPVTKCKNRTFSGSSEHKEKDWRKGKHISVTRVKDQGQCGSCWSFAATGTIEGAWARKTNWTGFEYHPPAFSEQQIVDCSKSYNNEGCSGGYIDAGITYAMDKGLEGEETYRYFATDGKCKYDETKVQVKPDGCYYIPPRSEHALEVAVDSMGPVGISINAGDDFQHYSWGVFDGACSNKAKEANHGVLIVGYNKDAWTVKNSWGASWGKDGYIEFKKGDNACGLANEPIVAFFN